MLRRLRQFRADVRAVAAVEFALVLPLLIGLYLGSIEAASLYSTDHKVATVASTMADLVSRQRGDYAGGVAYLDKVLAQDPRFPRARALISEWRRAAPKPSTGGS